MRTGRSTRKILVVAEATAHLQLAIEIDSDPISGSVSNGGNGAQPFTGWIELVAVIEAARSSAVAAGASGDPREETLGSFPGAKGSEL